MFSAIAKLEEYADTTLKELRNKIEEYNQNKYDDYEKAAYEEAKDNIISFVAEHGTELTKLEGLTKDQFQLSKDFNNLFSDYVDILENANLKPESEQSSTPTQEEEEEGGWVCLHLEELYSKAEEILSEIRTKVASETLDFTDLNDFIIEFLDGFAALLEPYQPSALKDHLEEYIQVTSDEYLEDFEEGDSLYEFFRALEDANAAFAAEEEARIQEELENTANKANNLLEDTKGEEKDPTKEPWKPLFMEVPPGEFGKMLDRLNVTIKGFSEQIDNILTFFQSSLQIVEPILDLIPPTYNPILEIWNVAKSTIKEFLEALGRTGGWMMVVYPEKANENTRVDKLYTEDKLNVFDAQGLVQEDEWEIVQDYLKMKGCSSTFDLNEHAKNELASILDTKMGAKETPYVNLNGINTTNQGIGASFISSTLSQSFDLSQFDQKTAEYYRQPRFTGSDYVAGLGFVIGTPSISRLLNIWNDLSSLLGLPESPEFDFFQNDKKKFNFYVDYGYSFGEDNYRNVFIEIEHDYVNETEYPAYQIRMVVKRLGDSDPTQEKPENPKELAVVDAYIWNNQMITDEYILYPLKEIKDLENIPMKFETVENSVLGSEIPWYIRLSGSNVTSLDAVISMDPKEINESPILLTYFNKFLDRPDNADDKPVELNSIYKIDFYIKNLTEKEEEPIKVDSKIVNIPSATIKSPMYNPDERTQVIPINKQWSGMSIDGLFPIFPLLRQELYELFDYVDALVAEGLDLINTYIEWLIEWKDFISSKFAIIRSYISEFLADLSITAGGPIYIKKFGLGEDMVQGGNEKYIEIMSQGLPQWSSNSYVAGIFFLWGVFQDAMADDFKDTTLYKALQLMGTIFQEGYTDDDAAIKEAAREVKKAAKEPSENYEQQRLATKEKIESALKRINEKGSSETQRLRGL